jgi:hypothetical protein
MRTNVRLAYLEGPIPILNRSKVETTACLMGNADGMAVVTLLEVFSTILKLLITPIATRY